MVVGHSHLRPQPQLAWYSFSHICMFVFNTLQGTNTETTVDTTKKTTVVEQLQANEST